MEFAENMKKMESFRICTLQKTTYSAKNYTEVVGCV